MGAVDAREGGPAPDAGGSCGPAFAAGNCQSCIAAQCCSQAAACGASPSCTALESCLGKCSGDATCRAQCGVDHGLGNDPATPGLEACLAGHCASACGLSCGGLAAIFPPARAADCQACIVENACQEVTACANDAACQSRFRCWFSSETLDVRQACVAGMDGGVALVNAGADPLAAVCSTECSWGRDWSCVGKVDWPAGTLGPVKSTVDVISGYSQAPIANATVEVCGTSVPSCGQTLATGLTGADGSAVLTGSIPSSWTVYIDITSPQNAPTDLFFFFPPSEAQDTIQVGVYTSAQLSVAATIAGIRFDPDAGSILVGQSDCRGGRAPGVTFSLTPPGASQIVYFAGGQLAPSATATDTTGVAIVFNAPALPAQLELTATVPDAGQPAARMPLFVGPSGIAEVNGLPTP